MLTNVGVILILHASFDECPQKKWIPKNFQLACKSTQVHKCDMVLGQYLNIMEHNAR